jgi:methylmalonyl-CoA/ethylmalonyl-CoA epimerase
MSDAIGSMHHVGIVVRDLDRAEAFVSGAIGLPVVNRLASPQLGLRAVLLACGPAMVELVEFSDPQIVRDRLGDRDAAVDHVALQVTDLEDAVQALAAHGVGTVDEAPMTTPAGRTHFTRADTSAGIRWQLMEPAGAVR